MFQKDIIITSAIALSDDVKSNLENKLSAKYGSGYSFSYKIQPSILAGLVIQVGDTEYHYDLQDQIEFILLELLK